MIGERDIRRVGRVCVGVCVRREGRERERKNIQRNLQRERKKQEYGDKVCVHESNYQTILT